MHTAAVEQREYIEVSRPEKNKGEMKKKKKTVREK